MPDQSTRISIKVQPNAGRNEVLGLSQGVWRIKVAAPPDKGKANKELIEFLSEILKLKKDNISLLRGQTSRHKIVSVEGATPEEVVSRLSGGKI